MSSDRPDRVDPCRMVATRQPEVISRDDELYATLKSWTPADVLRLNSRTLAGGLNFSTRMNEIP